jgi:hypothetical protein
MRRISFVELTFLFLSIVLNAGFVQAQTSAFTYQGKLTDMSAAANGNYDFTFRLFDAASDGTQIGTDVVLDNVQATNGIFTVNLDFGTNAFSNGAARFLEISVRTGASTGAFTTLSPRQQITSAPFSIKSLNATNADNSLQLGGVAANQFVQTNDTRLTDDRNPLPNSPNYIQNTTLPQSASNFNISGNGTVAGTLSGGIVNATTQFNFGGARVFYLSGLANTNTVLGSLAGLQNPTGSFNSFFGNAAGRDTTTGENNSFFGSGAGNNNEIGNDNSFFGRNAGYASTGINNSFFGSFSGAANTSGYRNSFFGKDAGTSNQTGNWNSFFGFEAGKSNVSGSFNSYFGIDSGLNSTGSVNTFIGSFAGENFVTGDRNVLVGAGAGRFSGSGSYNTYIGAESAMVAGSNMSNVTALGARTFVSNGLSFATVIGSEASVSTSNTIVLGRQEDTTVVKGFLKVERNATTTGSIPVCFTSDNRLMRCASSAEYGKEQQAQIERQQKLIESQQRQIDALKKLVCELKPEAAICGEEQK